MSYLLTQDVFEGLLQARHCSRNSSQPAENACPAWVYFLVILCNAVKGSQTGGAGGVFRITGYTEMGLGRPY